MATNRRRSTRSTRSTRSSAVSSTALKVYPTPDSATAADAPAATSTVDWNKEYHYIINDLRQLAIVSVLLFALLLIVGFLI